MLIIKDETTLCIVFRVSFHSCIVKKNIYFHHNFWETLYTWSTKTISKGIKVSLLLSSSLLEESGSKSSNTQLSPVRQGQRGVNTSGYPISWKFSDTRASDLISCNFFSQWGKQRQSDQNICFLTLSQLWKFSQPFMCRQHNLIKLSERRNKAQNNSLFSQVDW